MKKILAALLSLTTIACVVGCKKDAGIKQVTKTIILPANGQAIVQANNKFAFNLMQQVIQADAGNTNKLVSPLSIYLALGMVYNGADNATRDSMTVALQLSGLNINDLNNTCKALIEQLPAEDNKVALYIANSIWYRQGDVLPLQSFLDVNTNYFSAQVQGLDFNKASSAGVINDWVSTNTKGKINKVIDQLSPDDLMYLINAIYFKGAWQFAFKTQNTHNDAFHLQGGGTVTVPFMQQELTANTFVNTQYRVMEMPYGGGDSYSMYLIDGDDAKTINELAGSINQTILSDAIASMHPTKLTAIIPKWEYSYSIDDLKPQLAALGMGIAFTKLADFSKMYNAAVQITKAVHKTYIKVDEEGTTAAAVTSVGVGVTSVGPADYFKFDHPFVYVIAEKQTGTILFTGILNDPSK